jgi:flagellar basal-body rod modification protein FlgD
MSVAAVSSSTSTASTSTSSTSSSTISGTDFLQLLVTELENQNPLDPTDTNSFMTQLMSYANFSEQQSLNDQFSSLATSFNSMLSASAVGYLGQTVAAKSDTAVLSGGEATWGYKLTGDASNATITVKDSSGATVYSTTGETSSGTHSFTWDGTTNSGKQLADGGTYTISVSATDSSGTSVLDYTTTTGTVEGIDSSSGTTMLVVGGVEVALSDVVAVKS